MISFRQYILIREGLFLPDKPPRPDKPRINTTPFQNIRRTRTFRPRLARIARAPRVRWARVARVPTVQFV